MTNNSIFGLRGIEINGVYVSEAARMVRYASSSLKKAEAYKALNQEMQVRYSDDIYRFFARIAEDITQGLFTTKPGDKMIQNFLTSVSMQNSVGYNGGSWTTLSNQEYLDIIEAYYKNPQNGGVVTLPNGKNHKIKEVAFDYEFLTARDGNNRLRNLGIWEYSFVSPENIADSVEKRRYTAKRGLIGWNENDDIAKHVRSVIEKVKDGDVLTKEEQVAYDFMSRFGASVDINKMAKEGDRFVSPELVDLPNKSHMRLDNLRNAYNYMIKVGSEQGFVDVGGKKVKKGLWNFAQDYYSALVSRKGGYDYILGNTYNGLRAEIPVFQSMLHNSDLGMIFKHMGVKQEELNGFIHLDTMEIINASPQRKNEFQFAKGITSSATESLGSLEQIHAGLFKGLFEEEVHHNTMYDSMQASRVTHNAEFFKDIFAPAIAEAREVKSRKGYQNLGGAKSVYLQMSDVASFYDGNTIAFTYDPNTVGKNRTGNIFFNNRTVAMFDATVPSQIELQYDSLYANTPVQKNGLYRIDIGNVKLIDANHEIAINAKKAMGEAGANASQFVMFTMDSANGMYSTVIQPLELFQNAMAKQKLAGFDTDKGFISMGSGNYGYYIDAKGAKVKVDGSNFRDYFKSLETLRINERINDRILRGSGVSEIGRAIALNKLHQGLIQKGLNISSEQLAAAYKDAVFGKTTDFENYLRSIDGGIMSEEAWRYGFGFKKDKLNFADVKTWTSPYRNLGKYAGYGNGWVDQMLHLQGIMAQNPDAAESLISNVAMDVIAQTADKGYGHRKWVGHFAMSNLLQMQGREDPELIEGYLGKTMTKLRSEDSVTLFARDFIKGGQGKNDLPAGMTQMTFNAGDPSYKIWNSIARVRGFDPVNKIAANNIYDSWYSSVINENDIDGGVLRGYRAWLGGDHSETPELLKLFEEFKGLQNPSGEHQLAAAKAVDVLNKIRKIQNARAGYEMVGVNTANPTSIINGTGFNVAMGANSMRTSNAAYAVKKAMEQTEGLFTKIANGQQMTANQAANFNGVIKNASELAGILGNTSSNYDLYWKSISGIGEVKKAQLEQLYRAQQSGLISYSGNIYESITRAGGQMERINGRIYVSFGAGKMQDITSSLAKFEVNGNVMQYRIGDVAYAADGLLGFKNGEFEYISRLGHAFKGNALAYKIGEAQVLGKDLAETVAHMLSVQAGDIRTTPVGTDAIREMRNNIAVYSRHVFEDETTRNTLRLYLERQRVGGEKQGYIRDFLKELASYEKSSDKDGKRYTTQAFENAFTKLIYGGVISPEITIGNQLYRLGSNLSQKKVGSSGYLSMISYENGGSLFDDVGEGRNYIREHYVGFNQAVINENAEVFGTKDIFDTRYSLITEEQVVVEKAQELTTKGDVTVKQTKEFSVKNWEATTYDIDEALAKANLTEKEKARLSSLLNTYEGGAFVSGQLADTLGLDSGSKKTAIELKEVAAETEAKTRINSAVIGKQRVLKYNKGYVVGRNQELYQIHSWYGNENNGPRAKQVSHVTQKLFSISGMELTEAQVNKAIYAELANEIMAKNSGMTEAQALAQLTADKVSEQQLLDTANKLFTRKMVAENLEAIENIKIMTSLEKHEAAVGIDAFSTLDVVNGKVLSVLEDSKEFQNLAKMMGRDSVASLKLGTTLTRDIAELNFNNAVWEHLGLDKDEFVKQAIGAAGSKEAWKDAILGSRYYSSNLIKMHISGGADVVSYNMADALKHFSISLDIEDTYNELVKKHGLDKAQEIIKPIFLTSNDGEAVKFVDGHVVLTEKGRLRDGLGLDTTKLRDIRRSLGLSDTTFNADVEGKFIRTVSLSVADDAYNFIAAVAMGNREINALSNETYSNKKLEFLRNIKGKGALDLSSFEGYLDKDGNLLEKYQNISIWDEKTVHSAIAKNFFGMQDSILEGEHLLSDEAAAKLSAEEKATYDELRKVLGEDAPISKEIVKKFNYWHSGNNAIDLYGTTNIDKVAEKAKQYGFLSINAAEVDTELTNGMATMKNAGKRSGWIWDKNVAVDLSSGNAEINELLKSRGIKSTMFVSHGELKASPGEAIPLAGYQNIAKTMISDSRELADVQERINRGESTTVIGKKNVTLTSVRNNLLKRLSENQDKYETALRENFVKHNKDGIAEELNKRRVTMGANRTKTVIYNVNSLREGGLFHSHEFEKFTFQGKSLAKHYEAGNNVSFVVASTSDLERYGYNEEYFKKLAKLQGKTGEDAWKDVKSRWLHKAQTEGVEAFVNRSPSDYFHSTGTTRLYFSEHQNSGIIKTDSITAMLMKNDADGDTILSMMIGSKTKDNTFIDLNTYRSMRDSYGYKTDAAGAMTKLKAKLGNTVVDDLENLMVKHEQGMLMNIAERAEFKNADALNFVKSYMSAKDPNHRAKLLEDFKDEMAKRTYQKRINNKISDVLYAHTRQFYKKEEADALFETWRSSATEIESVLKSAVHNEVTISGFNLKHASDNWVSLSAADRAEVGRQLLKNDNVRKLMVGNQEEDIRLSLRAYERIEDSVIAPLLENVIKGNQEHVGEIDNPLFVLDTLADNFKNRRPMTNAETAAFKDTQQWREVVKEGYLSSKNTKFKINELDKAGEFSKLFKLNIENFIRSNGENKEAMENLISLTGEYGKFKVIGSRYGADLTDVSKEILEKSEREAEYMRRMARSALEYHQHTLANVNPILHGGGTNDYMRYIFGEAGLKIGVSKSLFNGTATSVFNQLKSWAFEKDGVANQNYNDVFGDVERSAKLMSDSMKQGESASAIRSYASKLRGLSANMPQSGGGNGLALKAVGLAAGIMLAGYAGGNPSKSAGSEAAEMPQSATQQQLPPQLIDPRIGNITGGPTQGYIINLNARSDNPNMSSQYIGRMIGNAMTNTYSNNSINVNLNVKERHNEISSSDLANYLMQAL